MVRNGPAAALHVSGSGVGAGARRHRASEMNELLAQFINLLGAVLLMLAFAMISQRRILSLITLFTLQGAVLVLSTAVVGYVTAQPHLYVSAAITFTLKVVLIPLLLHRVIDRLDIRWDVETLFNIPTTMLIGILLVVFAFNLALPIAQLSSSIVHSTLGIALACVLLSFMMMITRAKAVPQVIGFLSMENGLFFAATAATYGMPMVVELGIAFDVLVAAVLFGVFFFHIRSSIDSLDVDQLNRLSEVEK
jgi:hydrogenase-4 component E